MTIKDTDGKLQIGSSVTGANNLTIDTSANNGTASIYFGAAGAPVTTVASVASSGAVTFVARPTLLGTQSQIYVYNGSGSGFGSTNTNVRRFATTSVSVGTDITYADSATLGSSFTINTSGVYTVTFTDVLNAAALNMGITVDTTTMPTSVGSSMPAFINTVSNNYSSSVTWTGYIASGSVVRPMSTGAAGTASNAFTGFYISRVA